MAVAAAAEPDDLIDIIADAGLRGRGGAGFPTGIKWRTVADSRGAVEPTAVVVNAAEGEPGTFKDRAIIRRNPYRVLEGALIAARAVGAPEVIVATKASFRPEIRRLRAAIAEFAQRVSTTSRCASSKARATICSVRSRHSSKSWKVGIHSRG